MKRALLAGLALAALAAAATPALADTLIDNVDGVTIDATGGVDRFTGLLIGTMFTLFVVPMFYTLIARSDAEFERHNKLTAAQFG